tara:strand:- start:114 stop:518 length:405 start_codon:yes stop_codon:yes gene_type:complete
MHTIEVIETGSTSKASCAKAAKNTSVYILAINLKPEDTNELDKTRGTTMAVINREVADIILEAYYWDYKLVDNVATRDKKEVLACVTMYRDYDNLDVQISEALTMRDSLISIYSTHPDGEVVVKLTIKEEHVNI